MKDVQQLITDYFEDAISPEDLRDLTDWLHRDSLNVQEFMRAALLRTQLRQLLTIGIEEKEADQTQSVNSFMLPGDRRLRRMPRVLRERSIRPWRLATLTAAAMLMLFIGFGWWFYSLHAQMVADHNRYARLGDMPTSAGAAPVAILARAIEAQWPSDSPALEPGYSLAPNRYHLGSGYVEVVFGGGAAALIHGPAVFEVESSSRMRLVSGMLTTYVPPPAHGFTVDILAASVVDLGTEVGIAVEPGQESHIEVFTGKAGVQLTATGESHILTSNMAIRVDAKSGKFETIPAQPLAFTRYGQLNDVASGAGAATLREAWNRNFRQDPALVACYGFSSALGSPEILKNGAAETAGRFDGQIDEAAWDVGRFPDQPSLRFNGASSRVHVNIPVEMPSVTVAAWVNLHQLEHSFVPILMSDGSHDRTSLFHLQLSKISGRPVIEFSTPTLGITWNNYRFNAGDLMTNLNQWRFIATVYDTQTRIISCWLDDKCIGTHMIPSNPAALVIGSAQIGNWNESQVADKRGLNGRIGGIAIWSRPLASKEIESIYEAGISPAGQ